MFENVQSKTQKAYNIYYQVNTLYENQLPTYQPSKNQTTRSGVKWEFYICLYHMSILQEENTSKKLKRILKMFLKEHHSGFK